MALPPDRPEPDAVSCLIQPAMVRATLRAGPTKLMAALNEIIRYAQGRTKCYSLLRVSM